MTNVSAPTDKCIIDYINAHYAINIINLSPLLMGADIDAMLFKADAHDLSSYFIKLKRNHDGDIGGRIISLLLTAGVQELISPLKSKEGTFYGKFADFTLTMYPFIEGKNGFSRHLTDEQWVTLGKAVRKIHQMEVPVSIQNMIRYEDFSPKWREAVRALYKHIETASGADSVSSALIDFMRNHANSIKQLVDIAESLSKKIQNQPPEFVLCHSDIHGGNVLIDDDSKFYIVDWDDPIMAPKERDLMFMGGGIANVWNKLHEVKLFYTGYGDTDINFDTLAYYRCERIVEDIAIYGRQILLTQEDEQRRLESYGHLISQFEPNGVVEIAYDTYDNLTKEE